MYKEVPVLCKQQSPHFYEINAATANARVHALEEFHYLGFLKKGNQVRLFLKDFASEYLLLFVLTSEFEFQLKQGQNVFLKVSVRFQIHL